MFLQLLVPQYNETNEVIKKLLDSILMQRNINFDDIGVIIVNDGSNVHLSRAFLNTYPFEIKYILNEHKGVSAARNVALKEAQADYVMFCDADDMFLHCLAIQQIFNLLKDKKAVCLYSTFIQEALDKNSNISYTPLKQSFVFVHGKIYSREFLISKNIYWDEELTLHEDGYFNGLALNQVPIDKLIYWDEPFYLWCYNKNSITRKDPLFVLFSYDKNMLAQDKLIFKLLNINIYESLNLTAIQLFQTYFLLTGAFKDMSQNINIIGSERRRISGKLNEIETLFIRFYNKYKDCYKNVSLKERERLFESSKRGSSTFNDKNVSLNDFEIYLKELKLKYNIEFDDSPIELEEDEKE